MTGASLGNPPVHTDGKGRVVVNFIDRPPLVCSPLEAQLLASLLIVNARDAEKEAEGVRELGGGA